MDQIDSNSITTNELYQEKYEIYNKLISSHYKFYENEISDEIKKNHYL